STTLALFNVAKIAEDGSNWITYKERTLMAIGVQGLMLYADGCAVRPVPFVIDKDTSMVTKPDGTTVMQAEIDVLDKTIDEFYQKDSLVR
ncbi:hypothetical protein DFJ58DRAFT_663416, partial [Suillus subalutaceus]|uniref:uncharacterized protein n=1 Tax=Suillus subalutaceus TaxID=48586 RepID=UPI001B8829DE